MPIPKDRNEQPVMMEPALIREGSRDRGELNDLALELAAQSAGLHRSLPAGLRGALAELVRSMNCYYSNLIEGHDTHPVDIERALLDDFSSDPRKRDLQLEAKAHIAVQRWIDSGAIRGRAVCADTLREIHRRFCELLPDELLWVTARNTERRMRVVPGSLREDDVQVGGHVAVSPGAIARFLARFEEVYARPGKSEFIVALPAAHHRLLWIHPFLDGNGRVARLMSHAMLLDALGSGGVWSISRGLARREAEYKAHLARCDLPRRNDLDGRGSLSEEELEKFSRFFLETCLDQIRFMEGLMEPNRLRERILLWVEEEVRLGGLAQKSGSVLEAILYRGELPRSDVPGIIQATDRHARRVIASLVDRKVLTSENTRAPLRLVFPAELAHRWMPGLFPAKTT